MQTLCDVFRHCHVDHKPLSDQRWSQRDSLCILPQRWNGMEPLLCFTLWGATAGSGARDVWWAVPCSVFWPELVLFCVQPPPSGPGVAGASLPGGAPVPRFTSVLLQRREQAERVLTKSVSAKIVFAFGGRRHCLLKKPPEALSCLFFLCCSLAVSLCGRCFLSSPASSPSHSQFWHLASGCLVQKTRAFPSLRATSMCSLSGKFTLQLAGLMRSWQIQTWCSYFSL